MRALQIQKAQDLRVVDREAPELGPDDVQIDVEWGGICGSDLGYWRHGTTGTAELKHPLVLGHEVSGRIRALGSEVTGLEVGQGVTVHPAHTTGPLPERLAGRDNLHPDLTYLGSAMRDPHTEGGFSEVLQVRSSQVVALPSGLDTRRAVLAEPLGVAMHAVHRAGDVTGAHVLVSGCGPVGLLVIIAAKAAGAAHVTAIDLAEPARDQALAVGADVATDTPEDMDEQISVAFECSGAPASLDGIIRCIPRASRIVQVGNLPVKPVTVSLGPIVSKELEYRGTFRFVAEIEDAVQLLATSDIAETVISHEFPLDEAEQAFTTAATDPASSKVILRIG